MPTAAYIIAAAVTVDGIQKGNEAANKAKGAMETSRIAQEKSQSEQRAVNAARQAEMQRKTYREERVRRARILQSAENTGAAGSSGEYGALGNLETQLSTTLGNQIGSAASTERLSGYAQDNANAQFNFQNAQQSMSSANSQVSLGMSLFSSAGGMPSAPKTTPPPTDLNLGTFEYIP